MFYHAPQTRWLCVKRIRRLQESCRGNYKKHLRPCHRTYNLHSTTAYQPNGVTCDFGSGRFEFMIARCVSRQLRPLGRSHYTYGNPQKANCNRNRVYDMSTAPVFLLGLVFFLHINVASKGRHSRTLAQCIEFMPRRSINTPHRR